MFGDSWLIRVMFRASSNIARVMNEGSAATIRANRALDEHTGKIKNATVALESYRTKALQLGRSLSGSYAVAGTALAAYSAVQASTLQRTLTAIGNETGSDPRKMGQWYNAAFAVGNQIGVAPTEAARMLLDVSRMTAGQMQVAKMLKIAPSVAQFASMVNYNRPDVSVEAATMAGMQLAHQFRAYQPAQLVPLLDKIYRLSGLMGETPGQAVRQMSYYEPLFKSLKISDDQSIAMMALLDRAGFRMKVGTNVRAMMLQSLGPLQLTAHMQKGIMPLLAQMGVFKNGRFAWNTAGGGVDFFGELSQISQWATSQERAGHPMSDVAKTLYGVFGKQGGTIATLMADPQMVGFIQQIAAYQRNPNVSLAAGMRNRENTLQFQAPRAWANLQAVMTELAYQQLPDLTKGFKWLGDELHGAQVFFHQHRDLENLVGKGFFASIAGATVAFGGLSAVMAVKAVTMPWAVARMSASLDALTANIAVNSAAVSTQSTVAGSALGRFAASLGWLGSIFGALALSYGGIKLGEFGMKSFVDNRYGTGFYDKYNAYLRGIHGQYASSPGLWGDTAPAGGGMSEDQFAQHLRRLGAQSIIKHAGLTVHPSGDYGGGGFGAPYPGSQVVIQRVEVNLPNVTGGRTAAREIAAYLGGLGSGAPRQLRSSIRSNPSETTHMEPPSLRRLEPFLPHTH